MLELVSLLLAKGSDVNNYSHDLLTPIMWGTMHNDMDLLRIIISAGGNPLIKNSVRINTYFLLLILILIIIKNILCKEFINMF
jgi:ankyrin repeat protein